MSFNYLLLYFILLFYLFVVSSYAEEKKEPCIELKQITLDENDIFTKDKQSELFEKHIGKCIDTNVFKMILTTTSKYYILNFRT